MTRLEATAPGAVSLKSGDSFSTFGNEELCTWRIAPGVCRFQTRRPEFARKLSQRTGARLVAWSVRGGYLRVYQETIVLWRARNVVTRYIKAANGAFSSLAAPPARRKCLRVSVSPINRKPAKKRFYT